MAWLEMSRDETHGSEGWSFGECWSLKVMPDVLMLLMRHTDIKTTLNYYVGKNAKTTTNALWNAVIEAKSLQKSLQAPKKRKAKRAKKG